MPVAALVELSAPSTALGIAGSDIALRNQQIVASQATVLRSLAAGGVQVLYQVRVAANGIAVLVPAGQLDWLRSMPGVARVSVIPPKLPSSAASTAATAHGLAGLAASATGAGVRVGLIDRGVDYTHADFDGPGAAAAYAANDPTVLEPGSFPTSKVVGGYDFAGDNYDASGVNGSKTAVADPDPLECNRPPAQGSNPAIGQGTHDAGLVAGLGVSADGTTYHGPYGAGVDSGLLKIAPGVAPEAKLYALKIFGCNGSTTLLTEAIDRALDPDGNGNPSDHLDVLFIALSTPFGSSDDPDAQAVDRAVRAGMVVVVAAGDTVNTFYSVASPASARLAIAVGSSDGAGGMATVSARGPLRGNGLLKPDIVAPGVAVVSASVGTGSAAKVMDGSAAAAAQVAGAAALVKQLYPGWSPGQVKSALMNAASPITAPPSLAGAGQLDIAAPSGILAYGGDYGEGLTFGAPWLASSSTTTRTLRLENTTAADKVVTLSSTNVTTQTGVAIKVPPGSITVPAHGVAQASVTLAVDAGQLGFQPDSATAPKQDNFRRHYLAEQGGYIKISGAGTTGTRVRPGHAAHMDDVDFYLDDQKLADPLKTSRIGPFTSTTPGRHVVTLRRERTSINAPPIFSAPVDLADGKDYSLLVIGRKNELGLLVVDETAPPPAAGQGLIHFVNANRVGKKWNIGPLTVYLDGKIVVPALEVGQTSPYFPLAPGKHVVRFLHVGDDPAENEGVAVKEFVSVAGEAIMAASARHDDNEKGYLNDEQHVVLGRAIPRTGSELLASVPYNVFPNLASDAHVAGPVAVPAVGRAFATTVRNRGARNAALGGPLSAARTPFASAFELEARSPAIAGLDSYLSAADVEYLGVTSNFSVTNALTTTQVYFGLATYAPWSTPNEVQFRIYIDSNRDGIDDYVLVNTSWGAASSGEPGSVFDAANVARSTDVFASVLYPIRNGTVQQAWRFAYLNSFSAPGDSSLVNITPFNTSVVFQLISLADLALPRDPTNPNGPKGPIPSSFCYHLETRARDAGFYGRTIDQVPDTSSAPNAACTNRKGVLLYDVTNYAIAPINTSTPSLGQGVLAPPLFVDVDGGQIAGGVNPVTLAMRGADLLVLHHQNAPYPQAEVVSVPARMALGPGTRVVYITLATR